MDCTHDWGRYTDLPWGKADLRYRQCRICNVLGFVKHHGFGHKDRLGNVRVIHCYAIGCNQPAVSRLAGLHSGRLRWVCATHLQCPPPGASGRPPAP